MHKKEGGKLFENAFLERLTHTHIAVPLTIFYGTALFLIIYTLYLGLISAGASIGLFAGGLIFFTLVEYLVHRYAFHVEPTTPGREKFQYTVHGIHHDYPKDTSRLAMPPMLSILLATLFFLIYRYTMGNYGLPFASGFMAGYASYLCIHYIVHAYVPPKNFFKILWIHHAIHHYQQPERAFGVSSPLWDLIFRTMPVKKEGISRIVKTDEPV
jgi:4-hydroxysphinganine ceramide fatty acyl 2-hydroxylase